MARTYDLRNDDIRDLVLSEAVRTVRDEELLVVPTDTVYGIAADAFSPAGVRDLLLAKGRGRDMPPPVLVPSVDTLYALTEGLTEQTIALAEEFWPGALTIICNAQPALQWDLGETHGTVALRMPDHELTLELLAKTGPLAVSSANTSGDPAAEEIGRAQEMLGDKVSLYLDAGPVAGQGSSTIVDMTAVPPRIVRTGPISYDALKAIVPELLDLDHS
ncbi:L-threonylcarbamoyladenylate synthase [Brevibacterium sp. 50QC2O2]|uniref:L-threonylcarbamoyladenylate synthase n=1 Tax=Brevibacterium TaxID=1696 RepID=UPI00211BEA46|nr:L-threonylcarbamoyladenylate synthase [Brevibacterium sp. 91QC2O2]MCQ9384794.1 L-threonylcarbamoyladenylate synthase [Brevibacterium sp. 68QC2CO]MCQ9387556.1 L-threonylcarbamoyladenylate synthase [Brevibacterium sp. 50QC2O2]